MADQYSGNTTQVESDISGSKPNDAQLAQALNDAISKFSSGAGGTSTITVQNAVTGETTTAPVVNVDTTKGSGDVSGISGSTVLNFTGAGSVYGDLGGGSHVVVLGDGTTSLAFTNTGTDYISTGAGKTTLGVYNTGESTVHAGSGDLTLSIGNSKTTVDLTDSANATVSSGYGNSITTLGTGTYSIDAGGGYDFVNAGAKSGYTTSLDANGDIVLTDASGHVSSLKGVEVVTFSDGSTIVHATSQAEATIARMYEAVFNRTPDADGIAHFWNEYNAGRATLTDIANAFINSDEARADGVTTTSSTAFLNEVYSNIFGRAPDQEAVTGFGSALGTYHNYADVLVAIASSAEGAGATASTTLVSTVGGSTDTTPHIFNVVPDGSQTVMGGAGFDVVNFSGNKGDFQSTFDGEHTTLFNANPSSTTLLDDAEYVRFSDGGLIINANTEDQAVIARLYDGILDRNADSTGLQFWWGQHEAGTSLTSIANSLITSPEFTAAHASVTNTEFVGLLYENLLGRTGSATELAGYTSQIDAGASRADIAVAIAQAGEAQVHNADTIHIVYTP